ncbi:geranylgeranyl reductase family protein [Roseovarius sp. M141]|uniref:geranylgeranyl reductase family protein n=1 Tax=Roseovarius sp. M141 TaxID=2583806 RepID=UPI0020CDF7A8|nr:geranylgeranyl reductase family protein [Roseovarius sp. M141]MCQ0092222.1 geranylgeranyl reductase family protein [Roseovarius sp. M141]
MPRAPQSFDVLIIGAGPSGAAAAMTARRAGLSTALIDKAAFPRAKLCGGLVTGRARTQYREIFGGELDPDLFQPHREIAFYADGTQLGAVERTPTLYLTMRWDMDAHLLDLALAEGVADFTGRRIDQIDTETPSVTLEDGTLLSGQILIGADGVNSAVARALFGRAFDPARIGFALEIEAPAGPASDMIRIDFDAASWGYGWRFPKTRSTTIGVGGLQTPNPDIKARLSAYRAALGNDGPCPVKGHFLPFGDFRRMPGRDRVLLAGDAAGLVDPITGEGIAHALQSGAAAGAAAAAAIASGRPHTALPRYRRALRPLHRGLRMAVCLRPLIFAPRLNPLFCHAFARSSVLKGAYLRLLAGEVEYPGLCLLVLRRLPGTALRYLKHR